MAQLYGEQIGKTMSYFTGMFGLPPYANLTVVETEDGAPNGYAAPGMIFLAPRGIGKQVNTKLMANQVSRQWWEELVSPATRNHLWLTNGLAAYSELLWTEHEKGPGAMEAQLHDVMVESLTDRHRAHDSVRAAGRLFARIVGAHRRQGRDRDEHAALRDGRRQFLQDAQGLHAAVRLEDRRPPTISGRWPRTCRGQDLGYFFIQWIESSGAPEFKLEYTIFRTQKGFRVMGKIAQDLDTFRMPVDLKIETEGNPEEKRVEVVGTSSEFSGGYVRQAEERGHRSEQPRAALQPHRCAWRWPSAAASSTRN